jgi:hypothetical protein
MMTPHRHTAVSLSAGSIEGVFTSHTNPKYFIFHSSYQIFGHMHEVLNIAKKIINC